MKVKYIYNVVYYIPDELTIKISKAFDKLEDAEIHLKIIKDQFPDWLCEIISTPFQK